MTMLESLRQQWRARSPRERQALLAAGAVLLLAALVSVVDWTLREQQRLAVRLPEARAELVRMQDSAAELTRLNEQSLPAPLGLDTLAQAARAAAAARRRALDEGENVAAAGSDGTLRLAGRGAFGDVIDWLASLQAEQRAQPQRVMLEAGAQSVTFETSLATPAP